MSANTKIEWADHTFNPWIGCTKISPACDHCYAEADFGHRRKVVQWGAGQPRKRTVASTWAQPLQWNKEAERLGVRYRVFCASLADVFDNEVPDAWRVDLFKLIATTPSLDWLLLTKRIGNVSKMLGDYPTVPLLPNVWLGATICNQKEADRDIPKLLTVPAAKRFLSIEPLLGPVDFYKTSAAMPNEGHPWKNRPILGGIDWVIVGGESGPNARPMSPDLARSLRDQCQAAGVPFLFKQWGEWAPLDGMDPELRIRTENNPWQRMDGTRGVVRVGKKAAGRLLDGREWSEFPEGGDSATCSIAASAGAGGVETRLRSLAAKRCGVVG